MFSIGSLVASVVGVIALAANVIAMVVSGAPASPVLVSVFTVADVVGFSFGMGAGPSPLGRAGLHLSWAPLLAVLLLAGTFRPELSVAILESIGAFMFAVADGFADILVELLV